MKSCFKSANSIPPTTGNPSCVLNFKTTNNKNNKNLISRKYYNHRRPIGDRHGLLWVVNQACRSQMGLTVSDGSPMKHVEVSNEACRGLR